MTAFTDDEKVIAFTSESGAQVYTRLAAAFSIPASGIVLELNPVLNRLHTALGPAGRGGGATVFLEGFRGEGKGAQAYLVSRDWLRLGEAGVTGPTRVLLVKDARSLAQVRGVEPGTLVVLRRAGALADDEGAALFRQARRANPAAAFLTLVHTGLDGRAAAGVRDLADALRAEARGTPAPVWLTMQGVPTDSLHSHLDGRARLAGLRMTDEAREELVRLATLDTFEPSPAPRVLMGLVQRALDAAALSGTEPVNELCVQLRRQWERELARCPEGDRPALRALLRVRGLIAARLPIFASRAPAELVEEMLRVQCGRELSSLATAYPHLLRQDDGAVWESWEGLAPALAGEDDPGTDDGVEAALDALEARGALGPLVSALHWAARGRVEDTGRLRGLSGDDAWTVGAVLAVEEIDVPAAELPPEVEAAAYAMRTQLGKRNGTSAGAEVWACLLAATVDGRLDADTLGQARERSFPQGVTADTWCEVLAAVCRTPPEAAVVQQWVRLHPGPEGNDLERWEDDNSVRAQRHLRLLTQAAERLLAHGLEDCVPVVVEAAAAGWPAEWLVEAAARASCLPRAAWQAVQDGLEAGGPAPRRLQLRHLRIVGQPTDAGATPSAEIPQSPAGVASPEAPASSERPEAATVFGSPGIPGADDDGAGGGETAEAYGAWAEAMLAAAGGPEETDAWLLLDALRCAAAHLPAFADLAERLDRVEAGWTRAAPVPAFVAGWVLTRRAAPEVVSAAERLREALKGTATPLRRAAALQGLWAVVRHASNYDSQAQAATADRLLELAGAPRWVAATLAERDRTRESDPREPERKSLSDAERKAAELVRLAEARLGAEDDMAAARLLEEACALDPASVEAIAYTSEVYRRAGKETRVREVLSQGIERLGPRFMLVRLLSMHHERMGETEQALRTARLLVEASRGTRQHALQLHRAAQLAEAAGAAQEALDLALEYTQTYGAHLDVYRVLARTLDSRAHDGVTATAAVPELLRTLPLRERRDRLSLLVGLGAPELLARELADILREAPGQTAEWLFQTAWHLPPADSLLLRLAACIRADALMEAYALLEELEQVAPERTDRDFFASAVHLRFADEYHERGMAVHALHHLEIAFGAYVRALWSGYGGAELARIGAEILCLRLMVGEERIGGDEVRATRELLRVSSFHRPRSVRSRELSLRLGMAHLRSEAAGRPASALPVLLARHEPELLDDVARLAADFPDSPAGHGARFAVVDTLVGIIAAQLVRPDEKPALEAFLEALPEQAPLPRPAFPRAHLYHGEELLRLAEGLELAGAPPSRVLARVRTARGHLEAAGREGAASSSSEGALSPEDRMRLAIKLKRTDVLTLFYDERHSPTG